MKVVFFYCFVFFFLKNPAQSDWMLPTHIAGSGARTCSIYKTTPSQVNGKDSLTIKFAALEYNTKGKEISLSAFREDSVLDFRTTNAFWASGMPGNYITRIKNCSFTKPIVMIKTEKKMEAYFFRAVLKLLSGNIITEKKGYFQK